MKQFRRVTIVEDRRRRTAMRLRDTAAVTTAVVAALLLVAPTSTAGSMTGSIGVVAPPEVSEPVVEPSSATPAEVVAVPEGPQLSINLDNGKTAVTTGDTLDYVITVQNLGTSDIDGLVINQSLPPGMKFSSADTGGTADEGDVTWSVDLKATTTATFNTTMTVATPPEGLLRLASVACASTSADAPPIVCAAHSDQLPAGAAAEADQAAMTATPTDTSSWTRWFVIAGIVVLIVVVGLMLWWAKVRRQRRSPHPAGDLRAHDDRAAV